MRIPYVKIIVPVVIALFLPCCTTKEKAPNVQEATTGVEVKQNVLHIGITPDYSPMIFKLDGKITGVEADLAKRLIKELNRPGEFIELSWEDQIPALMSGTTDIIMSGMTITEERKVRINFSDYYMKTELLTLMRAEDAPKYDSLVKIKQTSSTVGVVAGTTGEAFVRKNFPNARVIPVEKPSDAPFGLRNKRLGLFVHDAPSIIWLVSENEAELKGFWQRLNEEYQFLGWGVRQDDKELLSQVNAILSKWKKDGTLKEILVRWLPYLKTKALSHLIE